MKRFILYAVVGFSIYLKEADSLGEALSALEQIAPYSSVQRVRVVDVVFNTILLEW